MSTIFYIIHCCLLVHDSKISFFRDFKVVFVDLNENFKITKPFNGHNGPILNVNAYIEKDG